MGAASIGQVHRATLKPSGRRVVVKVQYPGIEQKFRSDLTTTLHFCQLAMPQHVRPMREIEKQFVTEFDYEARFARFARLPRLPCVARLPAPAAAHPQRDS